MFRCQTLPVVVLWAALLTTGGFSIDSSAFAGEGCDHTVACAAAGRATLKGFVLIEGVRVSDVCAPPPTTCRRPCGVHHQFFKQAAGMLVGKHLLNPLFANENLSWADSNSLADPRASARLDRASSENWPRLVALRHPVDRLVSQFFATVEDSDYDLGKWIFQHSLKPPRRGNDGNTRLWIEVSALKRMGSPKPLDQMQARVPTLERAIASTAGQLLCKSPERTQSDVEPSWTC